MIYTRENILDVELFTDGTGRLFRILGRIGDSIRMALSEGEKLGEEFTNTIQRTLEMFNNHKWIPEEIVVKSEERDVQYTKDNILNLSVRRGGTAIYEIVMVFSTWIELIHISSGRKDVLSIDSALKYLNNGKWTVIGKQKQEKTLVEQIYQIY